MNKYSQRSPHRFHIPVMGTGFTIDTALKVAKYGISSVLSLVDDVFIEQMRKHHSEKNDIEYTPISDQDHDSRATRITAYLNLLNKIVINQIDNIRNSDFSDNTELTKYFELLPDSDLKTRYHQMNSETVPENKKLLIKELKEAVTPGSIDVNIMTKLDRDLYIKGEVQDAQFSDALSAFRGFAKSELSSSIIFSAGFNRRLFNYIPQFDDFYPDTNGNLKKNIILKVSDFRSALIQGKYLANKGLWVSEFRIESGINCGGHAFASNGMLIGPILDEFKNKRETLTKQLADTYLSALAKQNKSNPSDSPEFKVTVQGGIGTNEELELLFNRYNVNGTGWGTPFLLVPEVVNIDDEHLRKLIEAREPEVYLSGSSPLGIPFWNLKNSSSELRREKKIAINKPGSECPKGYLISNTEFTKVPICHASKIYQKKKIKEIESSPMTKTEKGKEIFNVVKKSCICHDLAGVATKNLGIDPKATPSICCGPNIVNFSKESTLEEMVHHIYGRKSVPCSETRPHMFTKELSLYIEYLREEFAKKSDCLLDKTTKYFAEFKQNLILGFEHYYELAEQFNNTQREKFIQELDELKKELDLIKLNIAVSSY